VPISRTYSFVHPSFDELCTQLQGDADLAAIRDKAAKGEDGWTIVDHLLLKEGKVFVLSSYPVVSFLLEFAHGMGHEGIQKTLHRLRSDFYIPGDRRLVFDFVRNCGSLPA